MDKDVSIDWLKETDRELLESYVCSLVTKVINSISIKNITSETVQDKFDLEIEDFNGWQCDWWANGINSDIMLSFAGCAWTGKVVIELA